MIHSARRPSSLPAAAQEREKALDPKTEGSWILG